MIGNSIDHGRHISGWYSHNHITLPFRLYFKLTLRKGEDDDESQTLETRINEQINKQIDDKIREKAKELLRNHQQNININISSG